MEGTVNQLPWCEQSLDRSGEVGHIYEGLMWMNSHGFLTINRHVVWRATIAAVVSHLASCVLSCKQSTQSERRAQL